MPSPAPLTYDVMQVSSDLLPIQQKSLEGQLLKDQVIDLPNTILLLLQECSFISYTPL